MSKRLFLITVVCIFCLANLTRWGLRSHLAYPRFVAEGAAHYRYTELVASGRTVPHIDRKAQWPEGLRVYRDTSIGMEYLYGLLYRAIPGSKPALPAFVRFMTAFIFSLAVFPLAYLSRRLWRSDAAGVITALLFASAVPLTARSCGFEFIRENVTFPLIIFHIYFFLTGCGGARSFGRRWSGNGSGGGARSSGEDDERGNGDAAGVDRAAAGSGWRRPVLSGLFLTLALATWQGTQFYLIPFLLFLVLRMLLAGITAGERRSGRAAIAGIVAAGAAAPFLRSGGFFLSIPVALSAAWLALDLLHLRWGRREEDPLGDAEPVSRLGNTALGIAAACVAGACIIIPGVLVRGHFASYSHFFELVLYKLRYVNKPADPRVLPFGVRAFWVGPFQSPDPRHIFVFALPLLLMLPAPMGRLYQRARRGEPVPLAVFVFLIAFFVLFLLMMRLLPLFGVFAVLAAGGIACEFAGSRRRTAAGALHIALAVLVLAVSLVQNFAWEGRGDLWRRLATRLRVPHRRHFILYPVGGDVEAGYLSWIRRYTPEDAVILTMHYLSPQVLTYTGRATNLNDFFESPLLRRKAERFLRSLYSSEERFYEFCREQSSDYVLVSAAVGSDPTGESPLYQAGLVDMPPVCAAYRFIFEPERLRYFNLVYENEMYRLFRAGERYGPRRWPRSPLIFERELLWNRGGDIGAFYDSVRRIYALTRRGRALLRQGERAAGEAALTEALRIYYFYPAWWELADLYRRQRRLDELESLALFGYRYDSNRGDVCLALARVRLDLERTEGVEDLLGECGAIGLDERQQRELRELVGRLGRLTE